jgi:hypothetical protein
MGFIALKGLAGQIENNFFVFATSGTTNEQSRLAFF